MIKVALTGLPGAGKSTSAGLLKAAFQRAAMTIEIVKVAAPLYDVQNYFYERCDQAMPPEKQDGKLLNFLGLHFRDAAPGFLMDDLAMRCEAVSMDGTWGILCDDARPLDILSLRGQGFTVIQVEAPDDLRINRKAQRGDRFKGDDRHPTEQADRDVRAADILIRNDGSLAELEGRIAEVAEWLMHQSRSLSTTNATETALPGSAAVLLKKAREVVSKRYAENRHQIGAAILTGDGRIFTGLHVEAMVGRASICAEAIALGKACEAGATDIRLVASVRHPKPSEANREVKIVPPCGLCRELLLDYGKAPSALLQTDGGVIAMPLAEMLPHKYVGTKWPKK